MKRILLCLALLTAAAMPADAKKKPGHKKPAHSTCVAKGGFWVDGEGCEFPPQAQAHNAPAFANAFWYAFTSKGDKAKADKIAFNHYGCSPLSHFTKVVSSRFVGFSSAKDGDGPYIVLQHDDGAQYYCLIDEACREADGATFCKVTRCIEVCDKHPCDDVVPFK